MSGRARWNRYGERIHVTLRLRGTGPHGRLHGTWNTKRVGARAVLTGRIGGRHVRLRFRALIARHPVARRG